MPFTSQPSGPRIYWKLEGRDDAPPLVLLSSIGTDMDLWDALLPALRRDHRVLRIDTRGHGASEVSSGDVSMAELAGDVAAVMDAAQIGRAAVAGVSLGGMIAMELALLRPACVDRLALVCTSATMDRNAWVDRVAIVRAEGMAAIVDLAMGRFLSPEFAAANPAIAATIRRQLLAMNAAGYAACATAIRDMDLQSRLGEIACPTLVVSGDRDTSTPFVGHGEHLLRGIAGARHVALPAAHLAPIEAPEALAMALLDFCRG
jgi:3-oxoadipate enol-lactonase